MKYKRYIQMSWILLLTALLLWLVVMPVSASGRAVQHVAYNRDNTSINATMYLSTATLQQLFQSRIDQQVPGVVNGAINGMVNKLPEANRGWATQMATALIQPSAKLTQLVPQQNGLAATLQMSLYPGDPQPINASMLVKFSVLDTSTVQVSAQPMNGGPALVNGQLATFQVPVGNLNSISTTPSCGSSALAVNMQFPLALGQSASQGQQVAMADIQQPATNQFKRASAASVSSYVEIPAASLATMGGGIGTLPINGTLSAQNIQVSVQGSNLVSTADIMLSGLSLRIGVATTYMQPTAVNGNLGVHVTKTTLTVFQIFTFPENSYDQQIQQLLNAKLSGALAGKFNVTRAAIGSNSQVPCAANNSLLITGTANVG